MRCFVCQKTLLSLNNLFHHLRNVHNLGPNSRYQCLECSCVELFDNLLSYKRHILRKHTQLQTSEPTNELRMLLESWDQEYFLDHFIDQKITVDILKIVKRYHIWQLLSRFKMGDIILFENNLETWRMKIGKPLDSCGFSHNTRVNENLVSPSVTTHQHENKEVNRRSPSISSEKTHTDPTINSAPGVDYKYSRNSSIILKDILSRAPVITEYYKKNKKFNDDQRKKLINLIARHFEDNSIHLSLPESYRLEKQIIERFPTEKVEYYRKGKRGKIYIKACNLRRSSKFVNRKENNSKINEDETTHEDPCDDGFEIFIQDIKCDNSSDVDSVDA